jgi:hypothetical protein
MKKLGLLAFVLGIVGIVGTVTLSSPSVEAGAACKRTTFQTKLVGDACKAGGQAAAKKAMKGFLKKAKKTEAALECNSCHSALAPNYPLKTDGFQHFKTLGGK